MSETNVKPLKKKRASITLPKSCLSGGAVSLGLNRKSQDKKTEETSVKAPGKLKRRKKAKQKDAKKEISQSKVAMIHNYLYLWKNDRTNWKFHKTNQKLLLRIIYDKEKLSDSQFDVLLEYLETSMGQLRSRIHAEAKEKCELKDANEESKEMWAVARAKKVMEATK